MDVTHLTASLAQLCVDSVVGRWVILVTDGVVIAYAPELYGALGHATFEARRWADALSRGLVGVQEVTPDRLDVGDFAVRIVSVEGDGEWVGTFWSWDGYPDPEAVLFATREQARDWACADLDSGLSPTRIEESEWLVSATFIRSGEEAYATVHRLKRVAFREGL
jgi:hypothetical protein